MNWQGTFDRLQKCRPLIRENVSSRVQVWASIRLQAINRISEADPAESSYWLVCMMQVYSNRLNLKSSLNVNSLISFSFVAETIFTSCFGISTINLTSYRLTMTTHSQSSDWLVAILILTELSLHFLFKVDLKIRSITSNLELRKIQHFRM